MKSLRFVGQDMLRFCKIITEKNRIKLKINPNKAEFQILGRKNILPAQIYRQDDF